jgi:hypothetical protein
MLLSAGPQKLKRENEALKESLVAEGADMSFTPPAPVATAVVEAAAPVAAEAAPEPVSDGVTPSVAASADPFPSKAEWDAFEYPPVHAPPSLLLVTNIRGTAAPCVCTVTL